MIHWWGWLLIWVGLTLALVAVLALIAFMLFRKAMALLRELSALSDKMTVLDIDDTELSKPQIAVLVEINQIRAQHDSRQTRRAESKLARHDRRISRAKRIMQRDASSAHWPEGWY